MILQKGRNMINFLTGDDIQGYSMKNFQSSEPSCYGGTRNSARDKVLGFDGVAAEQKWIHSLRDHPNMSVCTFALPIESPLMLAPGEWFTRRLESSRIISLIYAKDLASNADMETASPLTTSITCSDSDVSSKQQATNSLHVASLMLNYIQRKCDRPRKYRQQKTRTLLSNNHVPCGEGAACPFQIWLCTFPVTWG